MKRPGWLRDAVLAVVVIAVAVPVIVLVTRAMTGAGDLEQVAPASAGPALVAIPSPTGPPQSCTSCWVDKGAPAPPFKGEAQVLDGVQVLDVRLVDGYYRPNRFTVQAGVPVKVVFTGWAADCLAQPEFPELGIKGDMSETGQAVFALGRLEPGTYTFTCSMGVNEGRITVE